jgi:hypothetical protein
MQKRRTSFAWLLPLVELSFWAMIAIVPALVFFFRLKQMAHGTGSVTLSSEEFAMTIRSDRFLAVAFDRAGWSAEKPLTILNASAKFVEVLVSLAVAHKVYWYPASFLRSTWHAIIYPIYALPAWIYVGMGIDNGISRRPISRWNAALSAFLTLTCTALFCGFRFGMSVAEREGEELLNWFIAGLALWAALFAIPFAVWMLQKKRQVPLIEDKILPS